MQLPSFDTTDTARNATVALLTTAATALLALAAAYWSWQWLAPPVTVRAAPAPAVMRDATAAGSLFGSAVRQAASAVPAASDISLLGVVAAAPGSRGYAVLRLAPRQVVTVREGEDIASGIRLAEVATDHVIVDRAGTRQTLSWPSRNKTADTPLPRIGK